MANPNPKNKFQKGHARLAGAGRPTGSTNVLSKDIKTIIRMAAEEVGFIRRVPVLDAEGNPTGQMETKYGEGGELGYMKWLAEHHPGPYAMLYGKLIPLEVDAKIEEKPVVRYETVEERWRMGDREGPGLGIFVVYLGHALDSSNLCPGSLLIRNLLSTQWPVYYFSPIFNSANY